MCTRYNGTITLSTHDIASSPLYDMPTSKLIIVQVIEPIELVMRQYQVYKFDTILVPYLKNIVKSL